MRRFLATLFAVLALAGTAAAQVPPPTLPANTVYGRLGVGPGPGQAIPFATFLQQLGSPIAPAASILGNTTASAVASTPFAINAMTARGAPDASNDKLVIFNAATGTLQSITPGQIATAATAGVSSLWGLTGALGTTVSKTTTYAAATTDCGGTIFLGGTAFYTLTVGAPAGFATTCRIEVVNTDTTRGKRYTISSGDNAILWPLQSFVLIRNGASWNYLIRPPLRWPVSSQTVFVDSGAGSDTNDCLVAGAGACATSAQAMTNISSSFDNQGSIKIKWGCAGPPCTYTTNFIAQGYVGSGTMVLEGDTVTPDNVVMSCAAGCGGGAQFAIQCTNSNLTGVWTIQGFKTASAGAGVHGMINACPATNLFFNTMDFGTLNAASHVACNAPGASVQSNGTYTISGAATHFGDIEDGCVAHFVSGVGTVTGTPAFTSFLFAHGLAVIGTTASNFSGGATGVRCASDFNSVIDTAATSGSLPGNSACTSAFGGIVF